MIVRTCLLIIAAALVAVPGGAAYVWRQQDRLEREVDSLHTELSALAAREEELNSEIAGLGRERRALALWMAGTAGEASAQLLDAVAGLTDSAGLTLRRAASLPSDGVGPVHLARLRIEAEPPYDAALAFMAGLARYEQQISIERLTLRRVSAVGSADTLQPVVFLQADLAAPFTLRDGGQP